MSIDFETTILGGLPVEVSASIEGSDPSVGIFHNYAVIEEVRWPSRRRRRDGKFIEGKAVPQSVMDRLGRDGLERLADEALEA